METNIGNVRIAVMSRRKLQDRVKNDITSEGMGRVGLEFGEGVREKL